MKLAGQLPKAESKKKNLSIAIGSLINKVR